MRIQHPWAKFEEQGFAAIPWETHMVTFLEDRGRWLQLADEDWNRGGKMNGQPQTIGSLTKRLATHEAHHLETVRAVAR